MRKILVYSILFLFILTSCSVNKNEYYDNDEINKGNISLLWFWLSLGDC